MDIEGFKSASDRSKRFSVRSVWIRSKRILAAAFASISANDHFPRLFPCQDWNPTQTEFFYAGTWQHRKKDGAVIEVDLRWFPLILMERI